MKGKLFLFPYTNDSKLVLENKDSIIGYSDINILPLKEQSKEISGFLSPQESLEDSEAIVLCDNISHLKLQPYMKRLSEGIRKNKKVYLSPLMRKVLSKEFSEELGIIEKVTLLKEDWEFCQNEEDILFEIPVPVVCSLGLNENSDKFRLQLELYKTFVKSGFRCSAILSNSLGKLMDFHVIPEFMYDDSINLERKVLYFNNFVKDIVKREQPDVILIGIPGAIMPMNKNITNHFAEVALAIGMAVETDFSILNINYVPTMNKEFIEELKLLAKYKLNMPVEMVAISNQRILFNSESKELDTYFLSNSFVNEMHMTLDQDIPCPIFYMADKKNMRKNLHSVIKSLVENIDAV